MRAARVSPAARIALWYLAFAVVWIVASDRVVDAVGVDGDTVTRWQTVKGLVFVGASSAFVYLLARRYLAHAHRTADRLQEAYDQTLAGWASALDIRDHATGEHTQRVTELSVRLGRRLGLSGDDLEDLRRGATLHDIGKMALPDRVLTKPGPLDADEWAQVREHPELGVRMLQGVTYLAPALVVTAAHHEWWDGTGYPEGLVGAQIPLFARIFAVVDVFDALTSERVYRQPTSRAEALAHIEARSGTHFDPAVVEAFVPMMRE